MGCFNWANICELAGKFILNKLASAVDKVIQIYIRMIILNQSRMFSKVKVEKERKKVYQNFERVYQSNGTQRFR